MEREYLRLLNPFFTSSSMNYKTMLEQTDCNMNALTANQSNLLINARLILTTPIATNFRKQYSLWYNAKATSMGGTREYSDVIDELPEKLKHWHHTITGIYDEKTVTYLTLFSHGRNDIYKGTQNQQLLKFKSFETELKKYPDLLSVYDEVVIFNADLIKAHNSKGVKQDTKDASTIELDKAYQAMGEMLFSNFLQLTDIFIKDTKVVKNYFIFNLLRSPKKADAETGYVLNIPGLGTKAADISYSPDDTLQITNNGEKSIFCYSATTSNAPEPANIIEILAGDTLEITALSLGAPANKFLIFVNKETNVNGEVEIVLV